jgi:hypothetical protein
MFKPTALRANKVYIDQESFQKDCELFDSGKIVRMTSREWAMPFAKFLSEMTSLDITAEPTDSDTLFKVYRDDLFPQNRYHDFNCGFYNDNAVMYFKINQSRLFRVYFTYKPNLQNEIAPVGKEAVVFAVTPQDKTFCREFVPRHYPMSHFATCTPLQSLTQITNGVVSYLLDNYVTDVESKIRCLEYLGKLPEEIKALYKVRTTLRTEQDRIASKLKSLDESIISAVL